MYLHCTTNLIEIELGVHKNIDNYIQKGSPTVAFLEFIQNTFINLSVKTLVGQFYQYRISVFLGKKIFFIKSSTEAETQKGRSSNKFVKIQKKIVKELRTFIFDNIENCSQNKINRVEVTFSHAVALVYIGKSSFAFIANISTIKISLIFLNFINEHLSLKINKTMITFPFLNIFYLFCNLYMK